MSFSSAVKEELLNIKSKNKTEKQAELYGILGFSKCFFRYNYLFCSDSKNFVEKVSYLLFNFLKVKFDSRKSLYYIPLDKKIKKDEFFYKLRLFLYSPDFSTVTSHFLRGVFLSCGNITDPTISYRLEFSVKSKFCCNMLVFALKAAKAANLNPKISERKSTISVYMKDNTQITDFLTFIGATDSSMEFIQTKMVKEIRNYVNRTTNFEAANIGKTTSVALEQIKAIEQIIKNKKIDFLPPELKETAILRLENPYMSLQELSKLFSKPITKSGVNYRIKKLIEYSNL